jgi:ubiquinone/menaquinone biosynthesis C-methylase UbiE
MSLKNLLLNLYYFGSLSKEKTDTNQQHIRDIEWNAVKEFIKPTNAFLDVGCGAGYSMNRAKNEKNCVVFGIDPEPGAHGVGRYDKNSIDGLPISQGFAENIPYEDNKFDVVYSSHVLEHVNDESKSLKEMSRVLKNEGVLIIGMPTSDMAWVNFWTELIFTTHQRIFNVIFSVIPFIKTGKTPLINALIPPSHSSHRAKTVFFDINYYNIKNWTEIVKKEFQIEKIILPAYYPYPQYRQLFKMKMNYKKSSSVFFICRKLN